MEAMMPPAARQAVPRVWRSRNDLFRIRDHIHPIADRIDPIHDDIYPIRDHIHPIRDHIHPIRDRIYPIADHFYPIGDDIYPTCDGVRMLFAALRAVPRSTRRVVLDSSGSWNAAVPAAEQAASRRHARDLRRDRPDG
jgi:hypothetical protein